MKVDVVTATIGRRELQQCIASVAAQSHASTCHVLYIDGPKYESSVRQITARAGVSPDKLRVVQLPEAIGEDGWYGHRVYAACGFLSNADAICFLDDDNWLDPGHIAELVTLIESRSLDWAFSLRSIHRKSGDFVCNDNCESLGTYAAYDGDSVYHIDTNCFMLRRDVAVNLASAWYGKRGQDRLFFASLRSRYSAFACTGRHSSCYRLEGTAQSVPEDFFVRGNAIMAERHGGRLPWCKPVE